MGMAWNQFLSFMKDCKLQDAANAGISNLKNGMLDSLFKNREGHERRQVKSAFDILDKWNKAANMKQMVCKNLMRRILGKNDRDLLQGLKHLRENYTRRKTFTQCKTLFKSLEISDRCIDHTQRVYYKLLVNFNISNPWYQTMIDRITKNAPI